MTRKAAIGLVRAAALSGALFLAVAAIPIVGGFAMLFGRTDPFDDVVLKGLYPGGKDEYLERFEASLDATIAAGFILDDDREEILGVAAASYPLRVI